MKKKIGEFKVTDQRGVGYVAFEYEDVLPGGTLLTGGGQMAGRRYFALADGTKINQTGDRTFEETSGRRKFVRQSFD